MLCCWLRSTVVYHNSSVRPETLLSVVFFRKKKSSVQHMHPSSLGSAMCGSDCPTVSRACLAFCPPESYFEGTCSKSQGFFFLSRPRRVPPQ